MSLDLAQFSPEHLKFCSASFKNPFRWLQESLDLKFRQQHSPEEIEEARKQQIEKGQGSVFESLPELVEDVEGADDKAKLLASSPKAKGKKAIEVRRERCPHNIVD